MFILKKIFNKLFNNNKILSIFVLESDESDVYNEHSKKNSRTETSIVLFGNYTQAVSVNNLDGNEILEIILNLSLENRLITSLVNVPCYELYLKFTEKYDRQYDKALRVIQKLEASQIDENVPIVLIWENILKEFFNHTQQMFKYAKQLPGFEKICTHDFLLMLNSNIFVVFGLRINQLIIDGENYLINSNNIQFDKKSMYKTFGLSLTNKIMYYHTKLTSFDLSKKEIALLIPYILSNTSKF